MSAIQSRRVALVTGGRRGIGLGIANALAQEGFRLAVCGLNEGPGDALAALAEQAAELLYAQCDVGHTEDRRRLIETLRTRFGSLHVLVNNAGIAPEVRADLLEMSEASFERVLRTNLQGPFFLTQAVARWMLAQRSADPSWRGCIVNITSISATVASVRRGEYCISKAGAAMASKLWAARLAADGIPVYEVRPGIIRTDMTEVVRELYDQRIADGLVPQGRWGEPQDVGRAVAMLARGDLSFSTGAVIYVDGGLSIERL